ncbi:RagB/SusD family nutrient uptake outer membrane protein [Flavobacterium sp. ZB4P23]|uniref:RagB/SusD family nutrient uptake outer membrane protein n=1 Tax=unclassified Flavobacterium TaxID=196869 RepID=UPI000F8483B9|nr:MULTISPECIES: RagB/SusD family nutrient uptake outer membrane protein [unclassified Flavobacterium]RTY64345.1 RagB/SusD family nutrient uptake outer membrane protein [Flavobacterium sp. LB2P53]RTY81875.1 RagB/SusD family nutrient uptake outer membrane protein [Flavobacterium sp. ZB4P23]
MKNILILFVLLTIFSSCSDELDKVNPNEVTNQSFWQNERDAVKGINACYSTLHRGGFSRWQPMLYDLRSDVGVSYSPWSDLANAMNNFIQPDSNFGPMVDVYFDNYVGINRANAVLANVPAITMDSNLKARVLGEAYFFRGMHYYHLASLWGNVVLQLKPSAPTDLPTTSTEAKVWAQVVKDLTEAVASLPKSYADPKDQGRITKGGANALLAKAYMQLGDYEAAKKALDYLVVGDGASAYNLVSNYSENFKITSEFNTESVIEWSYIENPTEGTDNDVQTANHNYGTSIGQFYAPPGVGFSDAEALRWVVDEFEIEKTVSNERDPRLPATFLYNFTNEAGPAATMVYGQTFLQRYGNNKRVSFRKFLHDHARNYEGFRGINNYRFIRYADVLLMYAECLNATGKTNDAYQYVNRVRSRAGLAPLATGKSQQAFLTQIKHERLLELSGEGHRFNDLKRWGDLVPTLSSKDPGFNNFVKGKHELLPIPQRDLDINPNMTQNPNW